MHNISPGSINCTRAARSTNRHAGITRGGTSTMSGAHTDSRYPATARDDWRAL